MDMSNQVGIYKTTGKRSETRYILMGIHKGIYTYGNLKPHGNTNYLEKGPEQESPRSGTPTLRCQVERKNWQKAIENEKPNKAGRKTRSMWQYRSQKTMIQIKYVKHCLHSCQEKKKTGKKEVMLDSI